MIMSMIMVTMISMVSMMSMIMSASCIIEWEDPSKVFSCSFCSFFRLGSKTKGCANKGKEKDLKIHRKLHLQPCIIRIFKRTFVKPFMIVSINEPAGVSHRH